MDWSQLIIQLGISALVIFVGYQLAIRLITAWREGDKERTLAITKGNEQIVASMQQGFRDIVASMTAGFKECRDDTQAVRDISIRVEGKIDNFLGLTPVREMRAIHEGHHPPREPKVIIASDLHDDEETPPAAPPPMKVRTGQTPAKGLPYGPFTRPKTSGDRK